MIFSEEPELEVKAKVSTARFNNRSEWASNFSAKLIKSIVRMIECKPGTVCEIDYKVFDPRTNNLNWTRLKFDQNYLEMLPSIHGGTPTKPFFSDSNGKSWRIGWFVSFYDDESNLLGPFQEDHMYGQSDTRVTDRSMPYLLDGECSIYADHSGYSFPPFAALHEDLEVNSAPTSLAWDFGCGNDSLCFDLSTDPASVKICVFDRAVKEFNRCEYDRDAQYDNSHLIPVADSFLEFVALLEETPKT